MLTGASEIEPASLACVIGHTTTISGQASGKNENQIASGLSETRLGALKTRNRRVNGMLNMQRMLESSHKSFSYRKPGETLRTFCCKCYDYFSYLSSKE